MRKFAIIVTLILALALPSGCNPIAPEQNSTTEPASSSGPTVGSILSPGTGHLTPNPVETSMPIYGGTLIRGYWIPRSFDGHQKVAYGPTATLPVFNQLVMFDINYKETTSETIVGDLAESWETSPEGLSITFHLHQGVKWHDGTTFSADDVLYSLDKMTDPERSAISHWFPAYDHTEKLDDYTVRVHLKYASAGFMLALAQGESQIQALHLAGTDDQSAAFMVGTGPFILTEYIPLVQLKFKRNPDYFKKNKYGNQLPYLDSITYYHLAWAQTKEMMVGRRLDIMDTVTGASVHDTYKLLKDSAPELLWQRRERYAGSIIFLNIKNKPFDDIRVRRAIGLLIDEADLITGATGDIIFGLPGMGLLHPAFGLPKGEVAILMGWDEPYDRRLAEAKELLAEAGYPNGFPLNMMSAESAGANTNSSLVLADTLRHQLNIPAEIKSGLGTIELQKRLEANNYDTYATTLDIMDPLQLKIYFGTGGYANYANYSNPELDKIFDQLDHILDPVERQEAIQQIERILLTDLPALPTGIFQPNFMPYYPQVKNLRWNYISYSNINRLEDIWLDETQRVK